MDDIEVPEEVLTSDKTLIMVLAGAVVACAGSFALGYILGKSQGAVTVVPAEDPEDNQLTIFDIDPDVEVEAGEPKGLVIAATEYQKIQAEPVVVEETIELGSRLLETESPVIVNVFAGRDDDVWDHEAELTTRDKEMYVINIDEYFADDMGFKQETMTYYAGDDVMTDPLDQPIYNYSGLMGDLVFGHGSNDPNVVYIRNEKLHIEWEVIRHTGLYSVEVQGYQAELEVENELRHAHVPKFRQE